VGELAARHGIVLHELTSQEPSLEQAFLELTSDAVEYASTDLEARAAMGVEG
jgi:ABC-2 type transport system ATP-binding protein